jgi:hypothetical protein
MTYLLYLILAFVCINGLHGYLLVSQKSNRKWSISEHGAHSRQTLLLYIVGHLLGGAFFLLFAHNYFYGHHDNHWLFFTACIAVAFEYTQAFLPAKGKTNLPHFTAAYIMWLLSMGLGTVCVFVLDVNHTRKLVAGAVAAINIGILVYSHIDRDKLYRYQMIMVTLLYISLFTLVA